MKEVENYTVKEKKVSKAKVDANGNKLTKTVKSKNGREYKVVKREITTKEVNVDSASRLQARRKITSWLYRVKDKDGSYIRESRYEKRFCAKTIKTVLGRYEEIMI